MEYPILTTEEGLEITNGVIDQILNVDPENMVKAFYYWNGVITALAMMIDAQNAIQEHDSRIKDLIHGVDKGLITSHIGMKWHHEQIRRVAQDNFEEYSNLLLQLGVKI